jgi:hypothetical protein
MAVSARIRDSRRRIGAPDGTSCRWMACGNVEIQENGLKILVAVRESSMQT